MLNDYSGGVNCSKTLENENSLTKSKGSLDNMSRLKG